MFEALVAQWVRAKTIIFEFRAIKGSIHGRRIFFYNSI